MAHAIPREEFVEVELTFATAPADWTATGLPIKMIEPELDLARAEDENENTTPRRHAVLDTIPGLKSDSTFAAAMYFTASGVNAADQATAAATTESSILQAGLGGRVLGQRAQLDGGGSVSAPSVVLDPGYVDGQWVFSFDDSEGTGSFHKIDDRSATPVLTLLNDLPAAPDAADAFFACIMVYSDELNHDHLAAGYNTLSWLVQGEDPDDVFECLGCKPTVSIEGFEAGAKLKFGLDHMVADWADVMPVKQAVPGDPSGIAPVTVGTGVATTFQLADVGSPLANVDCRGTTEIDLGVTWGQVKGPCGQEGVKGYVSQITAATITIRVAFDDPTFTAEYIAGKKKHLLIQVGDQTTNAAGIYFGSLEYAARPKRIADGENVTTTELMFRAHEDPADTTGLTGDDLALRRAPFTLLSCA